MSMLGFGGYSEQQKSVERNTEVEKQSARTQSSVVVVVSPDELIRVSLGEPFTFYISVVAESSCTVRVESSDWALWDEEFFEEGEVIELEYQHYFEELSFLPKFF